MSKIKSPFDPELLKALDEMPTALKLDLAQFGLDLIGIVDPSGAADAANAAISLYRGDFLGAALSAASVLPMGDIAKFFKLNKYFPVMAEVVGRATRSPRLALALEEIMKTLKPMVDALPFDRIAQVNKEAADALRQVQTRINKYFQNLHMLRLCDVAPKAFPVLEDLSRMSPDAVRSLIQRQGFQVPPGYVPPGFKPATAQGTFVGPSEIWVKSDGATGYFVVRVDPQGHAIKKRDPVSGKISIVGPGAHGGRSHVHKEWIPQDALDAYLRGPVPQRTMKYTPNGSQAFGSGDSFFKTTHHPR